MDMNLLYILGHVSLGSTKPMRVMLSGSNGLRIQRALMWAERQICFVHIRGDYLSRKRIRNVSIVTEILYLTGARLLQIYTNKLEFCY